MLRCEHIIDEQEIDAVEKARHWARLVLRSAHTQPALGTPWKAYCAAFDHNLWLELARVRGLWR